MIKETQADSDFRLGTAFGSWFEKKQSTYKPLMEKPKTQREHNECDFRLGTAFGSWFDGKPEHQEQR